MLDQLEGLDTGFFGAQEMYGSVLGDNILKEVTFGCEMIIDKGFGKYANGDRESDESEDFWNVFGETERRMFGGYLK